MLAIGQSAPAFSGSDQHGKKHALSDFKGSWLLLYFYPKDDTAGCTAEACGLRDNLHALKKFSVNVIGVSADDEASHRKFGDKYALTFPLIADTDKKAINAYGVWGEKSMYGKTYMGIMRTSFLIDPNGIIQKIYEKVKPEDHAEEVLKDIKDLQK